MSGYADRFVDNRIDVAVLRDLTDQGLKELGVLRGGRSKMPRAIRDLGNAPLAETAPASKPIQKTPLKRRQLNIMFCALAGSTALSAKVGTGPEDLRAGFIAKHMTDYIDDGVLAYFGHSPSLRDAVSKLATNAGSLSQMRIGIATRRVVVGDLIGRGTARQLANPALIAEIGGSGLLGSLEGSRLG
jgi:class 3 adenylate cyclase